MAQVKFSGTRKGGEAVEVMAGWDRPLREFFLTIFASEDEVVWSDLMLPPTLKQTTEKLRVKLADYGIEPPAEFWERVELREANVIHVHDGQAWQTF